jgi:hypothetical protein
MKCALAIIVSRSHYVHNITLLSVSFAWSKEHLSSFMCYVMIFPPSASSAGTKLDITEKSNIVLDLTWSNKKSKIETDLRIDTTERSSMARRLQGPGC